MLNGSLYSNDKEKEMDWIQIKIVLGIEKKKARLIMNIVKSQEPPLEKMKIIAIILGGEVLLSQDGDFYIKISAPATIIYDGSGFLVGLCPEVEQVLARVVDH